MPELKPCPFCGSKDHLMLTTQEDFEKIQSKSKDNRACVCITCHQCFLDLYEHTHNIHDYNVRLELLLTPVPATKCGSSGAGRSLSDE